MSLLTSMADFVNQLKYDQLVMYETLKAKGVIIEEDIANARDTVQKKIMAQHGDEDALANTADAVAVSSSDDSPSSSEC